MLDSDFGALLILSSLIAVPILAHKKGRRWWLWLIPTFALGPLMLIPVLIIKKKSIAPNNIVQVSSVQGFSPSQQPITDTKSVVEDNSGAGYVYIISNPALPDDLIKIGFTERDPSQRIKELDQAGLPFDYIEHYRIFTKDARQLEARLHKHFDAQRFRDDKEFFKLSPQEVYEILKKWGVKSLEL